MYLFVRHPLFVFNCIHHLIYFVLQYTQAYVPVVEKQSLALYAESGGNKGVSEEEEMEAVRAYLTSLNDGTDVDLVMEEIAKFKARPDLASEDEGISVMYEGCAVDVAIDVIALALEVGGIPGGKKVARKLFKSLPPSAKRTITRILKEMNSSNFANKTWEVLEVLADNLTWNAITNSFSDFGLWEAAKLAASLLALFATGGAAFIIKLALMTITITELLIAIGNCEEIVG